MMTHELALSAIDQTSRFNLLWKYFTPEIYELLAEQRNQRYIKKTEKELKLTSSEMRRFMGVCILMGNLSYPRLQMYWEAKCRVACIADMVTQKRFLSIFANLAATSDEAPPGTTNIYWKIQPIADAVRNACRSLPATEYNSIDEQMIPFHGRVPGRQYIKNKPNPVGVQSFVQCGKKGPEYLESTSIWAWEDLSLCNWLKTYLTMKISKSFLIAISQVCLCCTN